MVSYNYVEFFQQLNRWGFTDALLPFLFVFVIIFAILQKLPLFGGDNKKKFNAVIAFTVGMFVVVPHIMGQYPPGWDVVEIMKVFLPGVSGVLIAFLMMLILIGLFGGSPGGKKGFPFGGWVAVVSFLIILIIFGAAAGWWDGWDWIIRFFGDDAVALIVMLLVFGIIIAYIMGDKKDPDDEDKGFFNSMYNFMWNKDE